MGTKLNVLPIISPHFKKLLYWEILDFYLLLYYNVRILQKYVLTSRGSYVIHKFRVPFYVFSDNARNKLFIARESEELLASYSKPVLLCLGGAVFSHCDDILNTVQLFYGDKGLRE